MVICSYLVSGVQTHQQVTPCSQRPTQPSYWRGGYRILLGSGWDFEHFQEGVKLCFRQPASPTSPLNLGRTLFSRVARTESSLHFSLVYFGQPEFEAIQEDLLVVGWFGQATCANLDAATSWQNDIHHS